MSEQKDALAEKVAELKKEQAICVWTEQEDGWWEACDGNAFEFTDGGPVENKVKWCPFCGRSIEVKKYESEN